MNTSPLVVVVAIATTLFAESCSRARDEQIQAPSYYSVPPPMHEPETFIIKNEMDGVRHNISVLEKQHAAMLEACERIKRN